MKEDSRLSLLARLRALGANPENLKYPGNRELRSVMPVPEMTLALLDEIAAALAEAAQPTKRGRPAGKDRLGELAERAAHAVEAGNDKDQVLAIAAKIAGLDKARARHLQIMLNSLLQDRAGKERK